MKLGKAAVLAALAATSACGQTNLGAQAPEVSVPFTMTSVATFDLPWRLAFLPDGRMLITEKPGPVWLVDQSGKKIQIANTPSVAWRGQGGMLGVYASPTFRTDNNIYLTYSEPGAAESGLLVAPAVANRMKAAVAARAAGARRRGVQRWRNRR